MIHQQKLLSWLIICRPRMYDRQMQLFMGAFLVWCGCQTDVFFRLEGCGERVGRNLRTVKKLLEQASARCRMWGSHPVMPSCITWAQGDQVHIDSTPACDVMSGPRALAMNTMVSHVLKMQDSLFASSEVMVPFWIWALPDQCPDSMYLYCVHWQADPQRLHGVCSPWQCHDRIQIELTRSITCHIQLYDLLFPLL